MAEIEAALVTYLKTQSGLTDLINNRIFPYEIPQKTKLPAVYYQVISDIPRHTLDRQNPLESPFIQFTVEALRSTEARAVRNQITLALKDYVGTLSGIPVQYIQLENKFSTIETSADGIKKTYIEDAEFQIFFERS